MGYQTMGSKNSLGGQRMLVSSRSRRSSIKSASDNMNQQEYKYSQLTQEQLKRMSMKTTA